MKKKTQRSCIAFLTGMLLFANTASAFAAEAGEKEAGMEWILSYAAVGLCVGLGLFGVIRSSKRAESVISEYERKRQQEEEVKKATGGH